MPWKTTPAPVTLELPSGRARLVPYSHEHIPQLLEALGDGTFTATLKSPPVDGKANAELVGLVARHFQVPKSAVAIKTGAGARIKRVTVDLP